MMKNNNKKKRPEKVYENTDAYFEPSQISAMELFCENS